ncbi:EAL domain-containing protein [Mesorhizobium sp. YM1C-6-2]|uniref:bifunctional diguanylate cyclase/phosphodiesterase n=1 Tax=Mesorhizobium sp. YM1C-6-2 TaxID=1827501 RepID=UPI001FDF93F0|nr:EAL domain-containing protein [Mesorhizobium sp. YM1C-6-2]
MLYALRNMLRLICRPTNVPVALALLVIVVAGLFAEYQNRRLNEERLRSHVLDQVSLIRAKLEGNVNSNIQLVRGLVATIATEPRMNQARFSELAGKLLARTSHIRNIVGAPGLVATLVHPLDGNEAVLGLDYNENPAQREAAFRARATGELVLAGPVDLVQGGRGLIGRFPVFVDDAVAGKRFWGIVSAVVELEQLYRDSGLLDPNLRLDIAISGRDGMGVRGERFFGSQAVMANEPVTADVILPSGSWQIAATPKEGWGQTPPNAWMLRLAIFAAGALILIPTALTGRLIDERLKNVDELSRREVEMERLSRRLELALDTSKIGVWEINLDTDELFWDDRTNQMFGQPADGGPRNYMHWESAVHPDDVERARAEFRQAVAEMGSYHTQYRLRLPDGTVRHIREAASAYRDPGAPRRMAGVNWDVTDDVLLNEELKRANTLSEARNAELESAKERIEFNALHDSLTGLPNRRFLDEVLAAHVEKFDEGERAGLLHLDLDRFKQINDTLGHAAGDAMLVHAARVLRANLRAGDFVARVGGDEFVVLCKIAEADKPRWNELLAKLADRVIDQMYQPVPYHGHECRFGVSIGIACDLDQVADPRRLLVNADLALYRAKGRGRNRYQFFNDALQAEIVTTKRIADDILSGLERNEFVAWYQPQFDATTHAIVGVEALARWKHPTSGLLTPNDFMRTAEELNAVATIDRMILEQALADFEDWAANGLKVPKVSVNVSARRLHDEELIRNLGELSIKPGSLSFELVESIFLDENDELFTWNVEQIKAFGIDIEIDDFGSGHASIVSLLRLKPRRLKIDRELVTPIVESPAQRHLVGSIIEIGKSLGIEVLAEGVETMEHARVLQMLGCNALQGHAFARAMSAADFKAFARRRLLRRAS